MDEDDDAADTADTARGEAEPAEAEYVFEGFDIQINERIALTPVGKGPGSGGTKR